jgi:hypothetical protein
VLSLGETAARALKGWRLAKPPGRTLVFGTANGQPDLLGNLQRRLLNPPLSVFMWLIAQLNRRAPA